MNSRREAQRGSQPEQGCANGILGLYKGLKNRNNIRKNIYCSNQLQEAHELPQAERKNRAWDRIWTQSQCVSRVWKFRAAAGDSWDCLLASGSDSGEEDMVR